MFSIDTSVLRILGHDGMSVLLEQALQILFRGLDSVPVATTAVRFIGNGNGLGRCQFGKRHLMLLHDSPCSELFSITLRFQGRSTVADRQKGEGKEQFLPIPHPTADPHFTLQIIPEDPITEQDFRRGGLMKLPPILDMK